MERWPSWTIATSRRCAACSTARRSPTASIATPAASTAATRSCSARPTTPTRSRTTASTSAGSTVSCKYLLDVHEPFAGYQRHVTTQNIDIDGDEAHAESYFLSVIRVDGSSKLRLTAGRYVDRLERRDREWRIADRVVVAGVVRRDRRRRRSIRRCRSHRASTATTSRTPARCTSPASHARPDVRAAGQALRVATVAEQERQHDVSRTRPCVRSSPSARSRGRCAPRTWRITRIGTSTLSSGVTRSSRPKVISVGASILASIPTWSAAIGAATCASP